MSTPAEAAERDFQKLIGRIQIVGLAIQLGQFRPTPEQRQELAQAITYLGGKIKAQAETPALEQPRPPSVIQQGHDATADFLRAINDPATQIINKD